MRKDAINKVIEKMMREEGQDINVFEWEWPLGVGLLGMFQNYKETGNKKILDWIISWYEINIKRGLPEKNINTTAPMLVLAFVAEETNNKKYMDMCIEWVNWVMKKLPRTENGVFQHICTGVENKNQVWDDTLFMTVLFVAKMAQILNDDKLREEVEYQFIMHVRYLYNTKTGLWYHGWTFEGNHNFAKALWGRGNCWITAGIPLCIELLPNMSKSIRRYLENVLECQVKALEKYQDKSGLWHTIIDDETSYLEASATAGFAYGILKAIHMNIIDEKYKDCAMKAIDGVIKCIDEDGTVKNVSEGTPMGYTVDFYKHIEKKPMAYGQSLAILALSEV